MNFTVLAIAINVVAVMIVIFLRFNVIREMIMIIMYQCYSHHDNPSWWDFVSNNKGWNLSPSVLLLILNNAERDCHI